METRRLQAFIRIVDTGSLTRAAQILGIAQPALSQQVTIMEADFGTQLLVRSRKGVMPTAAGKTLYRHAQVILRQLEQARGEVVAMQDDLAGSVHIGLPLTAAAILTVPLLRAAVTRYPNITLVLSDGLPGSILNEFTVNGRVDIGVLPGNIASTGLRVRALLRERLVLVVARDSELGANDDPLPIAALAGVPLVLPESSNRVRQAVDAAFLAKGVRQTIVAEMNSVYSLCSAAAANIGAAIVPLAGTTGKDLDLVVRLLTDPEIERPLYIASPDAAPLTASAQAIHDLIVETTERLIALGQWPGARTSGPFEV